MAKQKHMPCPAIPAMQLLRDVHISFIPPLSPYQEHGGNPGFLVALHPGDLRATLSFQEVDVATDG